MCIRWLNYHIFNLNRLIKEDNSINVKIECIAAIANLAVNGFIFDFFKILFYLFFLNKFYYKFKNKNATRLQ